MIYASPAATRAHGYVSFTNLLYSLPAATLKHGAEKEKDHVKESTKLTYKKRSSPTTSLAEEESFEIDRKHRLENMAVLRLRLRQR